MIVLCYIAARAKGKYVDVSYIRILVPSKTIFATNKPVFALSNHKVALQKSLVGPQIWTCFIGSEFSLSKLNIDIFG